MKYHIKKLEEPMVFCFDSERVELDGFAFIGDHGRCMYITYGAARAHFMTRILKNIGHDLDNKN
jgi:hypothetical protein